LNVFCDAFSVNSLSAEIFRVRLYEGELIPVVHGNILCVTTNNHKIGDPAKTIVGGHTSIYPSSQPFSFWASLYDEDGVLVPTSTPVPISVDSLPYQLPYSIIPYSNATYNVTIIPTIQGNYTVMVPINSLIPSFPITITQGPASSQNSRIIVERIYFTRAEIPRLRIQILDSFDNLVDAGNAFCYP
jgi:hypothetical protein